MRPWRCLAVWMTATAIGVMAWRALGATALSLLEVAAWRGGFEQVLVALASAALLGCAAWGWLVTTVTAWEVARGAVDGSRPSGLVRRWALAACGAALAAGVAAPASAAQTDGAAVLSGLPLPDRAVSTAPRVQPADALPRVAPAARAGHVVSVAPAGEEVVVERGDSLWALAAATLPEGASDAEVAARCQALYAANRRAVGEDPDLIHPGLRLRMPAPDQ